MATYFDTNTQWTVLSPFWHVKTWSHSIFDLSASFPLVFKNVTKIFIGRNIASGNALKGRNLERQVITGRLAQLVERRTREHNVSGLYRYGFESPAGQLKLLIVLRMRR